MAWLSPPASRTFPFTSEVAVCQIRLVVMSPTEDQCPLVGSYSSALENGRNHESPPPASNTWPLARRLAVGSQRASMETPVGVQFPLAGSYNSALARGMTLPKK